MRMEKGERWCGTGYVGAKSMTILIMPFCSIAPSSLQDNLSSVAVSSPHASPDWLQAPQYAPICGWKGRCYLFTTWAMLKMLDTSHSRQQLTTFPFHLETWLPFHFHLADWRQVFYASDPVSLQIRMQSYDRHSPPTHIDEHISHVMLHESCYYKVTRCSGLNTYYAGIFSNGHSGRRWVNIAFYLEHRIIYITFYSHRAMEDTKARREGSPASCHYQLIEAQAKSEHILQHNDTATTKDSHLSPREFTEPRSGNTFCFGDKSPKGTGSRIDSRYILPAASLVCFVSVIPLIVYATTHKQMAQITYTNQYDTYDCS